MREGKDKWTGLVYWDIFFTVKHNEYDFINLANVADSLLRFFFCHSFSVLLGPLDQKKKKKRVGKSHSTILFQFWFQLMLKYFPFKAVACDE